MTMFGSPLLARSTGGASAPSGFVPGGDLRRQIESFLSSPRAQGGALVPFINPMAAPAGDLAPASPSPDAAGSLAPVPEALPAQGGWLDFKPDTRSPGGMFAARPSDGPSAARIPLRDRLRELGAIILAANGNPSLLNYNLAQQQLRSQDRRESIQEKRLREQFDWQRERDTQPTYRTVNGQVISIPFGGGDPSVLYQAPEDFEIYADSLGLTPGSQEYQDAMRDFVLRSSGPTALDNRTAYENVRQGNRVTLEGIRQQNRTALTDQRERNFRGRPPRPTGPGSRGGSTGNTRRTVRDRTGRSIEVEVRNGQWVNVATGQPLQ